MLKKALYMAKSLEELEPYYGVEASIMRKPIHQ